MASLPSYAFLPFQYIRLSHVPENSLVPTQVILIILYRPKTYNAFTDTMARDLVTAFDLLSYDPRVKAIVVTGHGKMYCAGADINEGLDYADAVQTHRDGGGQVAIVIHRCTKPVIAAINGSAVGVGIIMTLPMNIRIVSSQAKIRFMFARRGIVMEVASSFFLPQLIGVSKAMHLVTTGSLYPASDPLYREVFSEVLPPEKVLGRALKLADDIAKNTSAVSTHLVKDLMWRNPGTTEDTHLLDSKILLELSMGKDKKEGMDSFVQKRRQSLRGR